MAHLREHEHGEDHRAPVRVALGDEEELRAEGQDRHEDADPDRVKAQAVGEYALPRRPGTAGHDARLGGLGGQREAGQPVGQQVDPEDVDGQQRDGQAQQGRGRDDPDLGGVRRQLILHEAADVVVQPPPLAHRRDDGREIVVEEDHRGGLLGGVGPGRR